mgnify:CR=1 FL=1
MYRRGSTGIQEYSGLQSTTPTPSLSPTPCACEIEGCVETCVGGHVARKVVKLMVSGLGGKHELDVEGVDSSRSVKQKIEPLAGVPAAEIKLIFKGKTPTDAKTVAELGMADGADSAASAPATDQGQTPLTELVNDAVGAADTRSAGCSRTERAGPSVSG